MLSVNFAINLNTYRLTDVRRANLGLIPGISLRGKKVIGQDNRKENASNVSPFVGLIPQPRHTGPGVPSMNILFLFFSRVPWETTRFPSSTSAVRKFPDVATTRIIPLTRFIKCHYLYWRTKNFALCAIGDVTGLSARATDKPRSFSQFRRENNETEKIRFHQDVEQNSNDAQSFTKYLHFFFFFFYHLPAISSRSGIVSNKMSNDLFIISFCDVV